MRAISGYTAANGGPLTLSVGVAAIDRARDHLPFHWIARADAALYQAKSAGRDRLVVAPSPASA